MPRLVRRRPLWERISSMLNPMDFLLWLSEEIETRDWDSELIGTELGLGLNFLFLVVRANTGSRQAGDDIFGDDSSSSWSSMLLYPLCWALVAFSIINAAYAVSRTRKYRLFEADIDVKPNTLSVRRVRVRSDPVASSPLRFVADMFSPESADARAHPEKNRDVWELSMWDPLPVCIRLLCLFSPGHVLVYLIFLPLASLDPRPSVTVFNTLIMQIVLSVQMMLLSSRYSQQARDSAIVQKEVFHEYDAKFVQPRIHPVVRDVGTQLSGDQPAISREFVQAGTPTTLIRRAFITYGNPHADSQESTPSYGRFSSLGVSSGGAAKPRVDRREPTPSHTFNSLGVSSGGAAKQHVDFEESTPRYEFNSLGGGFGDAAKQHAYTPTTVGRRSETFTPTTNANSIRSSGLGRGFPDRGHTPDGSTPVAQTPALSTYAAGTSKGTSTGTSSTYRGGVAAYPRSKSPVKRATSMGGSGRDGLSSPESVRDGVHIASERRSNEAPSSPTRRFEPRPWAGSGVNSSPHPFANMGKHGAAERFPKRWRA